jgi:hypothetical protein
MLFAAEVVARGLRTSISMVNNGRIGIQDIVAWVANGFADAFLQSYHQSIACFKSSHCPNTIPEGWLLDVVSAAITSACRMIFLVL